MKEEREPHPALAQREKDSLLISKAGHRFNGRVTQIEHRYSLMRRKSLQSMGEERIYLVRPMGVLQ